MTDVTYPILVVEDDAMVRSWVTYALEGTEFVVLAAAGSAAEAVSLLETRRPAVLLIDYRLADGTGTELVRTLRLRGVTAPAVLMTANREPGFNEAARESVAQGSVLKTGSADELLDALRRVVGGEAAFDTRHPRRDSSRAALSPREREAIQLVAAGATNPEVAEKLGVGRETVKTLLSRAFAKLGTTRRAEAVSEAHRQGLL
jgi:DNA-binding NarL/FixJ family response regulator